MVMIPSLGNSKCLQHIFVDIVTTFSTQVPGIAFKMPLVPLISLSYHRCKIPVITFTQFFFLLNVLQ